MKYSYQPIEEGGVEMVADKAFQDQPQGLPINPEKSGTSKLRMLSGLAVLGLCLALVVRLNNAAVDPYTLSSSSLVPEGNFDGLGRYIMRDFDKVKPMSNFLNGLGGLWGFPMWAFYVNRGQGIASFGKRNKDGGVLQFKTANVAYQEVPFTGFRTFLKARRGHGSSTQSWNHMPFYPHPADSDSSREPVRNMFVGTSEMEIEEVESDIGLKTNILYFTATNETFPSLIRRTSFTNLDPSTDLSLEVLDGLGELVPHGLLNVNLDSMGRTQQAWMRVYNVGDASQERNRITQPFFHISQGTQDSAEVQIVNDGYFSVAFIDSSEDDGESDNGDNEFLPFVVDPNVVYGYDTTLTNPSTFFENNAKDVCESPQGTSSRTPCAFAGASVVVPPGKSVTISSVYGYAENLQQFLDEISPRLAVRGYVQKRRESCRKLVNDITAKVSTSTSLDIFDKYVEQVSFLALAP